jgi:hypothetical protein
MVEKQNDWKWAVAVAVFTCLTSAMFFCSFGEIEDTAFWRMSVDIYGNDGTVKTNMKHIFVDFDVGTTEINQDYWDGALNTHAPQNTAIATVVCFVVAVCWKIGVGVLWGCCSDPRRNMSIVLWASWGFFALVQVIVIFVAVFCAAKAALMDARAGMKDAHEIAEDSNDNIHVTVYTVFLLFFSLVAFFCDFGFMYLMKPDDQPSPQEDSSASPPKAMTYKFVL